MSTAVPMFAVGAAASKPAATTKAGEMGPGFMYLASDTGVLYVVNDKEEWVSLTTGGGMSPVGAIHQYGGATDPVDADGGARWMICDGRGISTTTYKKLFEAFGSEYRYGGSAGTMKIPDLRGRAAVGADAGGTQGAANRLTSSNTLGASAGEQKVTLTVGQMPSHTHSATSTDFGHLHSATAGLQYLLTTGFGGGPQYVINFSPFVGFNVEGRGYGWSYELLGNIQSDGTTEVGHASIGTTVNANGGSEAHNNMPPYQVVNHIIRVS